MNRAALRLPLIILLAEVLVGVLLFGALTLFGPQMLLLDPKVRIAAVRTAAWTALPVGACVLLHTRLRLGRLKYVLRAMARGQQDLEADDILRLASLPAQITGAFLGIVALAILGAMLTPLRPPLLDLETAVSLSLLGVSIAVAAALPLYVLVRAAASRVLELANPDSTIGLLQQLELAQRARKRLIRRLLAATVTPVGFVAFGAALIANAHVRKFDQESRQTTAEAISRVALESSSGTIPDAGREEAVAAAARLGFSARIESATLRFSITRGNDGQIELVAPLEDGSAILHFRDSDISPITGADAAIALLALALSGAIGVTLGRWLADDLAIATRRVRMLRTDPVLLGLEQQRLSPPRFGQVALLNQAIDALARRFQVFASAQERTIEAREAARRVRSLLFASVSHDLRNPLNAILGFAGLIWQRKLSHPQRESLRFIEQSGRELLLLIETILDAAKIEAGRLSLSLSKEPVLLSSILTDTLRILRQTACGRPFEVELDLSDDLPRLRADHARLAQALATLLWFLARNSDPTLTSTLPRALIRARPPSSGSIRLDLFAPSVPSPAELESLLSPEPGTTDQRKYGALALGLGLSRSLVRMHGGTMSLGPAEAGTVRFELHLPAT